LRLYATDILLTVWAEDEDRLAQFWEKLIEQFCPPFENRFLVLILKERQFESPQSIKHNFSPPEFKSRHVHRWVATLVDKLPADGRAKERLIHDWVEAITQSCTHNHKLYTDRVYEHIESSLSFLKRTNSIDALHKFFEDWKRLYV
jgi:hypothetical protein